MTTPIFLLHGLGGHAITLSPLKKYLEYYGHKEIYNLSYPIDRMTLEESVDYVDDLMSKYVDKEKEIILIGQSMGGLISNNIHKKGWNVKYAIYIGSPLHGARLLNQLESILPTFIRDFMYKTPYESLQDKPKDNEPPHDYHCITMGWFGSDFDGCVYKDEGILDGEHHSHLKWADHRTIFMNPRLWVCVGNLLEKI